MSSEERAAASLIVVLLAALAATWVAVVAMLVHPHEFRRDPSVTREIQIPFT